MSIARRILLFALFIPAIAAAQTTEPTTNPALHADQTTPHGAIQVWLIAMAHNDGDTIRSVLCASNDAEKRMIYAIGGLADAQQHLDDALKAKFPDQYKDPYAAADAALARAMPQIAIGEETILGGDTAIYKRTERANPITLRKINGEWCLPISSILNPHDPASLDVARRTMDVQIKAFETGHDDIMAGKYISISEAQDAIKSQLIEAEARAATQPAAGN